MKANWNYDYPSDAFWLEITGVSNDWAYLTLHGTAGDLLYEIQSVLELTNGGWVSEGTVLGAADQDWTATMVAVGGRTNTLFFRARSWADSDGDGLPDWWELEHGLDPNNPDTGDTGVSDGYKDGDGDGWTNLQEYQNGTSPVVFNTPPPPRNLTARLAQEGTSVNLTWDAPPGPVLAYTVERADPPAYTYYIIAQIGTTLMYVDTGDFIGEMPESLRYTPDRAVATSSYRITAVYSQGVSTSSEQRIELSDTSLIADAELVRGPGGRWRLLCSQLPVDVNALILQWWEWDYFWDWGWRYGEERLDRSNFVGGVYEIPDNHIMTHTGQVLRVQTESVGGRRGPERFVGVVSADAPYFVDGREHLKENLVFLLRGGRIDGPCLEDGWMYPYLGAGTNHASFSYLFREAEGKIYGLGIYPEWDMPRPFVALNNLWPFKANYWLRNWLFDTNDPGWFSFEWQADFDPVPVAPVLAHDEPYWIDLAPNGHYSPWLEEGWRWPDASLHLLAGCGVTLGSNYSTLSLQSGIRNCYGLAGC